MWFQATAKAWLGTEYGGIAIRRTSVPPSLRCHKPFAVLSSSLSAGDVLGGALIAFLDTLFALDEQSRNAHPEPLRNACNGSDTWVSFTLLDVAQEGAVDTGLFRQLLL